MLYIKTAVDNICKIVRSRSKVIIITYETVESARSNLGLRILDAIETIITHHFTFRLLTYRNSTYMSHFMG